MPVMSWVDGDARFPAAGQAERTENQARRDRRNDRKGSQPTGPVILTLAPNFVLRSFGEFPAEKTTP